jgi:O-antigen ligase
MWFYFQRCDQSTPKSPYQGTVKIPRKLLALLILSSVAALFLTFSRSGYLAAGVGLLIFFFFKDWKIILLAIIIAIVGIFSSERATKRVEEFAGTFASIVFQDTDEIDPTAKLRIQNWGKSYTLFEKNKFAGIGYNTYRYVAAEEGIVDEGYFSAGGADSTHLTILVTTGIIGFLLYLLFLGNILRLSWQNYWRDKNPIYLGFFAGFSALIVHATFVNSLFFPLIFLPVMAVWGIISRKNQNK